MELLVCGWTFGEGYHVLFIGVFTTLSNMCRPCSIIFSIALQKFRHASSALLGWLL